MSELMGKETGFCKGQGRFHAYCGFEERKPGRKRHCGRGHSNCGGRRAGAELSGKIERYRGVFWGRRFQPGHVPRKPQSWHPYGNYRSFLFAKTTDLPFQCARLAEYIRKRYQRTCGRDTIFPAVTVDGNDVYAINDAMEEAIKRMPQAGKGPNVDRS